MTYKMFGGTLSLTQSIIHTVDPILWHSHSVVSRPYMAAIFRRLANPCYTGEAWLPNADVKQEAPLPRRAQRVRRA